MSQTILVEPHENLKKLYQLNLQTYTGTDVIDRDNAAETVELLKILPSINLIICRNTKQGKPIAKEIYEFLINHKMDIPMIILGEEPSLKEKVLQLEEDVSWEILVKHAGELLGVTEEQLSQRVLPNYIPIALTYFYDIDHTPCDVFIRIKKQAGQYKFVKRIHAQENLDPEEVEKYFKQGLKDLYIHKDYQQYFVTFVTNALIEKLEKELLITERLKTTSNAMGVIKEHLKNYGVSQEIDELVDSSINSMIEVVLSAPKMADLLKMLFSSKISYSYQKAHLCCAFGNFILAKQKWYDLKYLRTYACMCFFADITLKSPKLISINSNSQLEEANLDADERRAVLIHAKEASEITREIKSIEEDVSELIIQHHGTPDGVGFPAQPSSDTHAIAKIFIVADAFVKVLLDSDGPKNKKDILTILFMRFQGEDYQKIIRFLEQRID